MLHKYSEESLILITSSCETKESAFHRSSEAVAKYILLTAASEQLALFACIVTSTRQNCCDSSFVVLCSLQGKKQKEGKKKRKPVYKFPRR